MAERYDLVVVGAGPGGSSAAYHSAKAGLNTLLIDRQEFPRDKTCGDGLMPHAASEIALMGLADWLDEPHHGTFTGFSMYTHRPTCAKAFPLPCTVPGAMSQGAKRRTPSFSNGRSPAGAQFRSWGKGHRTREVGVRQGYGPRSHAGRRISALRSPAGGRRRWRGRFRRQRDESPPERRRAQAVFQRCRRTR